MRRIATGLVAVAFLVGGVTFAGAAKWGGLGGNHRSAAEVQYQQKPGCGPDKTDGVAGSSGRHSGQPPKDQDRGDCPTPPGQNR
jgi:hypothetical protein